MSHVYLIAYGCEPGLGGEAEVGWQTAVGLKRQGVELTAVTRKANAAAIMAAGEPCKPEFVFLESPLVKLKPRGRFSYFYYLCWQWTVWRYLRTRVKPDDIVHLLTFGNIMLPTFVGWLPCRLVLGPMGGGAVADPRLMSDPSWKRKAAFLFQRAIKKTFRFLPHIRHLLHRADVVIARTGETLGMLPRFCRDKAVVMLETGVRKPSPPMREYDGRMRRIVTVSRLIDTKNVDQVIEIYGMLKDRFPELTDLDVVGDGPCREKLQKRYGDVPGVHFLGKVPHERIGEMLRRADLFLFCSIKEGGSNALFEAAAAGLPIACYDVSGMTVFPPDAGAMKSCPKRSRRMENMRALFRSISETFPDGEAVGKMVDRALKDMEDHYLWPSKCAYYKSCYDAVRTAL